MTDDPETTEESRGPTVASRADWASEAPVPNKFLLCAVAFLRAQQLSAGAKPRIEDDAHKPAHLAVLEVLADTVSWNSA